MNRERESLFAPAHREGQEERIDAVWDRAWPLTVPRTQTQCAKCGAPEIIRSWRPFLQDRGNSPRPWRCDVSMKCTRCGMVTWHGVPITRRRYVSLARRGLADRQIMWREGYEVLREAGYLDEAP